MVKTEQRICDFPQGIKLPRGDTFLGAVEAVDMGAGGQDSIDLQELRHGV